MTAIYGAPPPTVGNGTSADMPCRDLKAAVKRREMGQFAGQVKIHDDFDELPDDIAEAFGAK